MKGSKTQKGFSLLEVVISMLASVIVLAAVMAIFDREHSQALVQEQTGEMNQNARLALNMLQREIVGAGFEFRDEVGGLGLDPRLAIQQWDSVGGASPVSGASFYAGANSTPPTFAGLAASDLPPAMPGSDALAVTAPFAMLNPATGRPSSACAFVTINAVAGGNYIACVATAVKCSLLASRLSTSNTFWTDNVEGTIEEPALLLQYTDATPGERVAAVTLPLSNVTYSPNDGGNCPGPAPQPSITFTRQGAGAQGYQILPQKSGYLADPLPGAPFSAALVTSHFYYLTSGGPAGGQSIAPFTLLRVKAGHTPATHVAFVQEVASGVETFQLQFINAAGAAFDFVGPGGLVGAADGDTLNDTQRIASIQVGLEVRTSKKDTQSHASTLVAQPLFNYAPGLAVNDGFHRRVLARAITANNLRYLP